MAAKIEITLSGLMESYDWAQVFADENAGNVDKSTTAVPPGSSVDVTPPSRKDVVAIIAAVNGENEGADWLGVFLLQDGRYLIAEGGCDYTGWDCRAGNSLSVASSLQDAIRYGLNQEQQQRLGLLLLADPVRPDVLDYKFESSDLGREITIREYFVELLKNLWYQAEEFSGKRPFGNSGWQYEIYGALILGGYIEGRLDEDGCVDEINERRARDFVIENVIARLSPTN